MIVHLVKFNKAHTHGPANFQLPTVEDLAYLIQIHSMNLPKLALGGDYLKFLSDPFLQSLEQLRVQCALGANLVACHVDRPLPFGPCV